MSIIKTNKIVLEEQDQPSRWFVAKRLEDRAICESDVGHQIEVYYEEVEDLDNPTQQDEEGNPILDDMDILRIVQYKAEQQGVYEKYTGNVKRRGYSFEADNLVDVEQVVEVGNITLEVEATKIGLISGTQTVIEENWEEVYEKWKNAKMGIEQ